MKVDLIITTYNRPDALACVLHSVKRQTVLPQQVIIADDGSGAITRELIKKFQQEFPVVLIHSWHEDDGFRAAESRNLALSKVKSEYVIIIDGDIVLEKHFVEDHLHHAKAGYFLQGGRVLLTEIKTKEVLKDPQQPLHISLFDSKIESRLEKRLTAFRSILLGKLCLKPLKNKNKIRSCNMSFYYKDILAVNGFNNAIQGWGREDSEFAERLFNAGVKGKLIKFVAIGYHLFHPEEPRTSLPKNDEIMRATITQKKSYCEDGLQKFL